MIPASLARFINASEIATIYGLKAYARTPDFVESAIPVPYCVIDKLTEPRQELWIVGDAQRKENQIFQVCFKMKRYQDRRDVETRFRRLIESATATDSNGLTHPGIDYLAFGDLLRNSGDNLTYFSDQPDWTASPTPIVYKNEDANGEPIVVASGYTVSLSAGSVTFSVANSSSDRIRATYKMGLIDFNIAGVAHLQDSDVENNPQRFAVAFDLETHYYIKATANRYL